MNKIDYEGKVFTSIGNSETGEVSSETVFYYRQKGELVWAHYEGGAIILGNLIAKSDENGNLNMRYQHLNKQGKLMTGECFSTPEILPDDRIRLCEKWKWTSGDFSEGESTVEEVKI